MLIKTNFDWKSEWIISCVNVHYVPIDCLFFGWLLMNIREKCIWNNNIWKHQYKPWEKYIKIVMKKMNISLFFKMLRMEKSALRYSGHSFCENIRSFIFIISMIFMSTRIKGEKRLSG